MLKKNFLPITFFIFITLSTLLLTSCSNEKELSKLVSSYLDASFSYYYDAPDTEAFEKVLNETALPELKEKKLEEAQAFKDSFADGLIEVGDEKMTIEEYYKTYHNDPKIEIQTDISPVYDDLDKDRSYYKYVFVRVAETSFNADGSVNENRSSINIYCYDLHLVDDQWGIYSISAPRLFPYTTENVTTKFNNKDVSFTPYSTRTLTLESRLEYFNK